ncbi:MAG: ORF6N domain-containing protein [Bacteroidales bacterium]|nr:ORF6N domain-containing protein [Bacteroidales bacterium]
MEENGLVVLTEEYLMSKIYIVRGVQVMLDADLAAIYGYTTARFNEQVKNNIERFDDDFRFQLTDLEFKNLMSKFSTSSWGGTRKSPYAFTELGIYSLMMVLKGDLAVKQSKKLIRLFKKLKDFAIQIQNVLPSTELQALAIQTQNNSEDIRKIKQQMVTHDELSVVIKDFTDPNLKKEYLLYNGQAVEADLAYSEIYSFAKKTIHIIDNYIGLKTLILFKDVSPKVKVFIFSDNVNHGLHQAEFADFQREYPNVDVVLKTSGGIYHDRYIFVDHGNKNEMIFHCGGSSKDGGKRVTSISRIEDVMLYQNIIENLRNNPTLQL